MSKEIPWRRVLVEGVVIVSSILLALGLRFEDKDLVFPPRARPSFPASH